LGRYNHINPEKPSKYAHVTDPVLSYHIALLSSLWVSRTGSASDWCALQEVLYKCLDTIQYNTLGEEKMLTEILKVHYTNFMNE